MSAVFNEVLANFTKLVINITKRQKLLGEVVFVFFPHVVRMLGVVLGLLDDHHVGNVDVPGHLHVNLKLNKDRLDAGDPVLEVLQKSLANLARREGIV